jgi:hypothetical protein
VDFSGAAHPVNLVTVGLGSLLSDNRHNEAVKPASLNSGATIRFTNVAVRPAGHSYGIRLDPAHDPHYLVAPSACYVNNVDPPKT